MYTRLASRSVNCVAKSFGTHVQRLKFLLYIFLKFSTKIKIFLTKLMSQFQHILLCPTTAEIIGSISFLL